jgi:hypothetical protein
MRKAAPLAASGTQASRTLRSQLGIVSGSDRGPRSSCGQESKIIMVSDGPRVYWLLNAYPQVRAAIAKRDSFRMIRCEGDRVATDFFRALSEVDQLRCRS